ncbi:MAG: 50S ribosomal protein L18 [Candidatus Omnitrophica bacterium]|nr:50S ribosomal protein L18 [Candidatus Omnitrophota bacterium]MDD5026988.1 50S ribosomal protein L18 [Candidatus Omnitrophota bacterium]MDD5661680.1 50S ribosomal protein L18 [Candidatus Omnitrophota bacterium]
MNKKELSRLKRHRRIKMKMQGSKDRPRLVVKRSLNNLSAQIIDDTENKVLFSYSTASKEFKQKAAGIGNVKSAQVFGEAFSRLAKEKGISKIIFDRAGYLYHGRIKEFAESLRKGGMEF